MVAKAFSRFCFVKTKNQYLRLYSPKLKDMKIVKIIGAVLVALIAIPLIAALFIPKEYAIKREVVVNKPSQAVFDYIKYVKNQDHFSVWNQMDPEMKKSYNEVPDGTVGFKYSWEGNEDNVGTGSQTITQITEGKRLDMRLDFVKPFEAHDDAYMELEPISANETKVTWGFNGAFPYPMNFMRLFFDMDKQVGGDLGKGLDNLKVVLEAQPEVTASSSDTTLAK